MYTNATSILMKLNELEALLTLHEIDVCSISETWLQSTNIAGIPGFVPYRKDCPDSDQGGGIFVHSTLSSHELIIPGIHSTSEQVWFSINLGIKTMGVFTGPALHTAVAPSA